MTKKKKSVEKKEEKKSKDTGDGLGVAGFTLGIISIVVGLLIAPILGVIIAIIGFTLCMVQQKRHPTKKAKTGIILNVIGFAVSVIWWIIAVKFILPLVEDQLANFPA